MKKNNIIVVLLAIAAMVCSCQKEIEGNYSNLVKVSFSAGRPVATRTDISSTGAVTWNALDHLAVFTDVDGSNVYDFSVSSMNPEQTVAEFDGSVPSNGSRTAAYVIYPYAAGYTGGPAALEVEVPATQEDGTNYTLMAAKGAVAGDDFASASMTMKHLCWIYDVTSPILLPSR